MKKEIEYPVQEKLIDYLEKKGVKHCAVAVMLKITYRTFSLKINGKNDFKWGEVQEMCEFLHIDNPFEIFI